MKRCLIIAEKKSIKEVIQDVYEKNKDKLDFVADVTFMGNPVSHTSDKAFKVDTSEVWQKLVLRNIEVPEGYFIAVTKFSPIQIEEIKTLINTNNYDFVVNACDPCLYGQFSYEYTKEKVDFTTPSKRMCYRDLTEPEVLRALKELVDNDATSTELLKACKETGSYY